MAGANVRVAWTAGADAQRQYWRVYATDDLAVKGTLIAEVDPEDRVYLIRDVDEGPFHVRVIGVSLGGTEEDWAGAVVGSRTITRQTYTVATTQNSTAASIETSSAVTVILDPPRSDEPATQIEVIRGSDPSLGQLVGTYPVTRADVTGEGGERQYTYPIVRSPGVGTGVETLQVRAVVPGGHCAGAVQTMTIPSMPLVNYDATTRASIVTGTLTNIYAPTSLLAWEHGTYGVRLREVPPSSEWLGGWGTSGAGVLADAYSGAYYMTLATISTATLDLGADTEFVLECWDEAQRSASELAFATVASKDLTAPSNPVEIPDLDGGTLNPDWIFHEIRSDGKPHRPLEPTRWAYRYGLSDGSGSLGKWLHYIPGTRVRARYIQAKMRLVDPLGYSQIMVPRAYVRTWTPHDANPHSQVIASAAGLDPDPADLVDVQTATPLTGIEGEVIAVRGERGDAKLFVNVGGTLHYVALTS